MRVQSHILISCVILPLLVSFLACEDPQQVRAAHQLHQQFIADSLWISAQSAKPVFSGAEIETLKNQYHGLYNYPQQYFASRSRLTKLMESFRVRTKVGTIYTDEFSGETIKENTREVVITFKELLAAANEKTGIIKVAKGFKSTQNRRAFNLKQKYGWNDDDCATVASGRIRIGMNKDMVRAAWGHPDDINRTTTSYGVHEQWVYGTSYSRNYVYFEDGTLTSIQN